MPTLQLGVPFVLPSSVKCTSPCLHPQADFTPSLAMPTPLISPRGKIEAVAENSNHLTVLPETGGDFLSLS